MLRHVFIANGSPIYHTDPLSAFLLADNSAVVRKNGEFTSCQSLVACLLGWESDHQHLPPPLYFFFSLCGCLCLSMRTCTRSSYSVYHTVSNHQMPSEWMYEQMKNPRHSNYYLSRLTICKVLTKIPVETWKGQGTVKPRWTPALREAQPQWWEKTGIQFGSLYLKTAWVLQQRYFEEREVGEHGQSVNMADIEGPSTTGSPARSYQRL